MAYGHLPLTAAPATRKASVLGDPSGLSACAVLATSVAELSMLRLASDPNTPLVCVPLT
jgi:hypothetical protein